jgi:hypothetical protein
MASNGGLHHVQTGSGRLAGKVAIVTGTQNHPFPPYLTLLFPQLILLCIRTGAASGFGLATTNLFVSEGCKVVAADMNGDGLAKHFSDSDVAHNVATVTGTVTEADTWTTLVSTAKEKFGGLDIVINNAGTSYRNKPTAEVTEAEFDKCFTVNVKSVFLSIPAAVPALEERGGGAIINIASIGATRPRPGLVWYNASKGAVANVGIPLSWGHFGRLGIRAGPRAGYFSPSLTDKCLLVIGNQGARSRIRSQTDSRQQPPAAVERDRFIRDVRRSAVHARKCQEFLGECAAGQADGSHGCGKGSFVPR